MRKGGFHLFDVIGSQMTPRVNFGVRSSNFGFITRWNDTAIVSRDCGECRLELSRNCFVVFKCIFQISTIAAVVVGARYKLLFREVDELTS